MAERRARRTERFTAADAQGLLGAVILLSGALSAFVSVFQTGPWLAGRVIALMIVLGVPAIARSLGAPRWSGVVVAALTGLVVLTAGSAPSAALLAVIPTPAVFGRFGDLATAAADEIERGSIPLAVGDPMRFLLTAGIVTLAVLVELVAVAGRMPAVAGAIALPVLVAPSLLTGELVLWPYVVASIGYLLMLRSSTRAARSAPGSGIPRVAAVGVVGILAASVVAGPVPGFYGASLLTTGGGASFGGGVSPLIDLGKDLQGAGDRIEFIYTTDAESTPYFRLLTLDEFDGTTWVTTRDDAEGVGIDGSSTIPNGFTAETPTVSSTTTIDITTLRERLLPVPYAVTGVSDLDGDWLVATRDATVYSTSASTVDQRYTATSESPQPSEAQLRAAATASEDEYAPYLAVDGEVPSIITRTLDEVAGGASTPYDVAVAVQAYLRSGDFAYSLSAPVQQGYDGDGLGVIATFLERKAGYCVHFASTMAVMARLAGIPSRIGLGFLGGTRVPSASDDPVRYQVSADDLHAWPELYFEGIGWVPFEPTPGRGEAPSYAPVTSEADAADDLGPSGRSTATSTATTTPTRAETEAEQDAAGATREEDAAPALVVGAALVLLLAAPLLVRTLRRAGRRRRASAEALFAEVVDTARDLGLAGTRRPDATPRSWATGLLSAHPDLSAAEHELHVLVEALERERYGPAASDTAASESAASAERTVTRVLRAAGPPGERIRALLAPRSVLAPERRPRPATADGG